MAAAREYELVLMLDPGPDEAGRDALAQDVRARIEGAGTLKHENKWGLRKMAYEIAQRNEADYRWFRFEATNDLLDNLNHNLKIADGVLRFRIFKVDADAPVMVPPTVAATHGSRERGPQGPSRATASADETEKGGDERGEGAPAEAPEEPQAEPAASAAEPAAVETPEEPAAESTAETAAEPAPETPAE